MLDLGVLCLEKELVMSYTSELTCMPTHSFSTLPSNVCVCFSFLTVRPAGLDAFNKELIGIILPPFLLFMLLPTASLFKPLGMLKVSTLSAGFRD